MLINIAKMLKMFNLYQYIIIKLRLHSYMASSLNDLNCKDGFIGILIY